MASAMSTQIVNLDRLERHRRDFDQDEFEQLAAKYQNDAVNGRTNLLTEWKRRRLEHFNKAFGHITTAPMHHIVADEAALTRDKGVRMDTKPIATGLFSSVYAAKVSTT